MTKDQAKRLTPLVGYYTVIITGGTLWKPSPGGWWFRGAWAILALGVFPWLMARWFGWLPTKAPK